MRRCCQPPLMPKLEVQAEAAATVAKGRSRRPPRPCRQSRRDGAVVAEAAAATALGAEKKSDEMIDVWRPAGRSEKRSPRARAAAAALAGAPAQAATPAGAILTTRCRDACCRRRYPANPPRRAQGVSQPPPQRQENPGASAAHRSHAQGRARRPAERGVPVVVRQRGDRPRRDQGSQGVERAEREGGVLRQGRTAVRVAPNRRQGAGSQFAFRQARRARKSSSAGQ